LILPEDGVSINWAIISGKDCGGLSVESINHKEIGAFVVALVG